jgi:diguanylate cyclase (GGDEF)-like protein/PAS domain S-box-containing protein
LKESEQRLSQALEAARMGIFDWDLASGQIIWTPRTEEIYGFRQGEFDGSFAAFASRVHPEDLQAVEDEVARCREGRTPYTTEHRVIWPDGSLHWVIGRGEFTYDDSGQPVRMRGTAVDITDRKLAEIALYANRELLEKIINSAPSSIFALDRQHRFILTNQAHLRVWPITAQRLLGHTELEALPPITAARLWADNEEVMRTGQPMQREEELQLHDGLTAEVMTTKFPLRDKDGAVIGLGGVATDITARKSAERQLRGSEERLRLAMDAANMGAFDWDLVRNRIVWSRRHQELWGYAPGEFGGTYEDFSRRVHPDDLPKIKAELARSKAGRCPYACEYRLALPNGTVRWVAGYGEYAFGEDGQPKRMHGMVMDITERKHAEKALLETEVLWTTSRYTRNLIETSLDPLMMISPEGKITDVNAATETATGQSRGALIGKDFADCFAEPATARAGYLRTFRAGSVRDYALEIRHQDGRLTPVQFNAAVFRDENGHVQGAFVAARDITAQRQAELALRKSEAFNRAILNSINNMIAVIDRDGNILAVNDCWRRFASENAVEKPGKPTVAAIVGKNYLDICKQAAGVGSEGALDAYNGIQAVLTGRLPHFATEYPCQSPTQTLWFSMRVAPLDHGSGGAVITHIDVTELKKVEETLEQAMRNVEDIARHDSLTGLPNRWLLVDRLNQAVAQAERSNRLLAVCYLDLDGFKLVNDTHGHAIGDKFLVEIAHRLQTLVRANDTVSRLGGDEFVVLLTDLDNVEECQRVLERIVEAINQPVPLEGKHQAAVTASVGIALFPRDAANPDSLLRHADQAMYAAKQSGRNCYRFFDHELEQRSNARLKRLERIRQGLEDGEFRLYFQPKVDFGGKIIIGVEALIRWQHPVRGLLEPAEFLPDVENDDLALVVGDWTLREALRQMQTW